MLIYNKKSKELNIESSLDANVSSPQEEGQYEQLPARSRTG